MNRKRINGLRRPLAIALATALTAVSLPIGTVSASSAALEALEAPETVETEESKEASATKEEESSENPAPEAADNIEEIFGTSSTTEIPDLDTREDSPEDPVPDSAEDQEDASSASPEAETPATEKEDASSKDIEDENPDTSTEEESSKEQPDDTESKEEESSSFFSDQEALEKETEAEEALEKVTNLLFDKGTGEAGSSLLTWDDVQGAELYEIRFTDSENREYALGHSYDEESQIDVFSYSSTSEAVCSPEDLAGTYHAYQKTADGSTYEEVLADGEPVLLAKGSTYTVYVRAVDIETVDGESYATGYGGWSDGLEVTIPDPVEAQPITNVKLYEDIDNPSISYTLGEGNDYAEVEIIDEQGRCYYPSAPKAVLGGREQYTYPKSNYSIYSLRQEDNNLYSWVKNENGEYEPERENHEDGTTGDFIRPFEPGCSYAIRLRGVMQIDSQDTAYSSWSEAYVYSVPDNSPNPIGYVQYVPEYDRLIWGESTNADGYEIELTDDKASYNTSPSRVWDKKQQKYVYDLSPYIVMEDGNFLSTTASYYKWIIDQWTDTPVHDMDSNGIQYEAFKPGTTYTTRIRAYRYQAGTASNEKGSSTRLYSEWTEAYRFTIPSDRPAILKLTGLEVNADNITWNLEPNADRLLGSYNTITTYQIEIIDEDGKVYGLDATTADESGSVAWDADKQYFSVNNSTAVDMSELPELYTYTEKTDDSGNVTGYVPVSHNSDQDSSKNLKAFEGGRMYTIRVRAMRTYDGEAVYGEWSDAAYYRPPAAVALTDLSYVKSDRNYYYFTYQTTIDSTVSTIYYQIASNEDFSSASIVTNWTPFHVEEDLLKVPKNSSGLGKSKIYYIRAVNYANDNEKRIQQLTKTELDTLMPCTTSFTTDAARAPKNITGFKLYKEEKSYYEFRFDAVLSSDDEDLFELQISQDPNSKSWRSVDSWEDEESGNQKKEARLYKSQLDEGTTYVRATAYILQKNGQTGEEEKVYGTPSNMVAVTMDRTTSSISGLKLVEQTDSEFVFSFTGTVGKQQYVEYQYSLSKNFTTDRKDDTNTSGKDEADEVNNQFRIGFRQLTAGKKYYVRARVVNENAKSADETYSDYTNVVKITTIIPKINVNAVTVTKNSITLRAGAAGNDRYLSGYEIQRKEEKSWKSLAKTSDSTYTDTKLEPDTTYSYRVRPYFYNSDTKKTTNGTWAFAESTTWSGALKLTAAANSKTSVKLAWNRISDAEGYEVYRRLGSYRPTEIVNGKGNDFEQFKLIASTGSDTKSYTDKNLTSGMDYTYLVVAYKTIDGSRVIIQERAGATLDWKLVQAGWVKKSNGKVTWSWNPVYGAKGYLVEKKDHTTGKWSVYKKITKAKTKSITLPRTKDENGVTYRVRAYNGKKYTNALEQTVYPVLAIPGSVKAKASSANGSITVTWKKVNGADYYRVYRTTDSWNAYNKDVKGYVDLPSDLTPITLYVEDSTKVSGFRPATTKEMGVTKLVDKEIAYTANGTTNTIYEGPKTGVTYYYYVVAFKNGTAYNYGEGKYDKYYDDAQRDGEQIRSLYSKAASAIIKSKNAPGKATVNSLKAAKGQVTVNYKRVKGAEGYEILRSVNKTKGFEVVGTVLGEKKVSYVDKKLSSSLTENASTTYYYKVQAFIYNEAGLKEYGKASAVKQIVIQPK